MPSPMRVGTRLRQWLTRSVGGVGGGGSVYNPLTVPGLVNYTDLSGIEYQDATPLAATAVGDPVYRWMRLDNASQPSMLATNTTTDRRVRGGAGGVKGNGANSSPVQNISGLTGDFTFFLKIRRTGAAGGNPGWVGGWQVADAQDVRFFLDGSNNCYFFDGGPIYPLVSPMALNVWYTVAIRRLSGVYAVRSASVGWTGVSTSMKTVGAPVVYVAPNGGTMDAAQELGGIMAMSGDGSALFTRQAAAWGA